MDSLTPVLAPTARARLLITTASTIKLEDDSVSDQSGAPITMLTESNADLSEQLKEEDAEMRVSADEPPTSEETGSTVALGQTTV